MVADTGWTPTRPIMVFVWQFGSVAVFASIVGALGRRFLPWRGIGTRA